MIHFDLPKQKSSIIKVLGVGGGGSNAVNFMFEQNIEGVDFIICNTDAKAIEQSRIPNKIQLGPHLTQGLGAGANPEVGKKATEESLDEIKRILEVNTKMAFITVGMGGGTGTGGAPIIAQICKDLGILTVGIVTTPFGFEGPRRLLQAEEGIRQLKPFVDTLLVISNDKLRVLYGDLKMKEAFGKADNVLATAAKCITDIINSRGHIIVDFADVCTVMKNGGVAILGKAEVEGENRAQKAIEEALASPLLNDSEIKGAKWILININSAEGENECTMDEMEIINNHLRMQAGPDTDVIVGMGYDNTLNKKIGITLVATGFEHKDPFAKPLPVKQPEVVPEKIVMVLGMDTDEPVVEAIPKKIVEKEAVIDPLAPSLQNSSFEKAVQPELFQELISLPKTANSIVEEEKETLTLQFELSTEITQDVMVEIPAAEVPVVKSVFDEMLDFKLSDQSSVKETQVKTGFLSKPSRIYADQDNNILSQLTVITEQPVEMVKAPIQEPELVVIQSQVTETIQEEPAMQLVMKEEIVTPVAPVMPIMESKEAMNDTAAYLDEAEEQKRRAAERIQKLRNLSYNMNSTGDNHNEFDAVPAYVRRNMDLFGSTLTSVENFYSKVTVGRDENNQTQISTLNTFLEGKKPD
jgi:cell division protein FtsZ